MFPLLRSSATRDALAQNEAIKRSQAVIEFGMDGSILTANENFLRTMGYALDDVQGQHHSMFVDPKDRSSDAYRALWHSLGRGEVQAAEFRLLANGGRPVWMHASYNPVFDEKGRAVKVVQVAIDITAQKLRSLEDAGWIAAIGRAQAVIEFALDGTIVDANENFLRTMGYQLSEIVGQHHAMFVTPEERTSDAYRDFWAELNRGRHQSGEFKRLGKGDREVWILASYSPILGDAGQPIKVVKFATDVTADKLRNADFAGQIAAIGKSQAVIEFNMDGTIISANEKFLDATGYTLADIQGRHHQMFIEPQERASDGYREFWAELNRGSYQAGEFKRLGKGGREVWIQASYNPIRDLNGKPFKVVKYASDITAQVLARLGNERVRDMMEHVAAGAEELSSSVREISDAMTKSRGTAADAVRQVENADANVQSLSAASQAMESIVDLINNITGQINLLALNATIESARAGEAGRGFAVVASEVKSLANQARQANDKIAVEIQALSGISGNVVTELDAIKQAIQTVSEYVASTADTIAQQSCVASEMSANMQRAAAEAAAIATQSGA